MLFLYYQLRHAIQKQVPSSLTLESDPVEGLLLAKVVDKPLSVLNFHLSLAPTDKLERTFGKWQVDIPCLTEDWKGCLSSYVTNMISARDCFLQVQFVHRAHFPPENINNHEPRIPVSCPRCGPQAASFLHMVLSCPRLDAYRSAVLADLNRVTSLNLESDPKFLLLNVFDDHVRGRYTKLFLSYATFYACREIFLHWKDAAPPIVSTWRSVLNPVLPLYKIIYPNWNYPKKFNKIW